MSLSWQNHSGNKNIMDKCGYINSKRILVTGVCGTVGSALVHFLLNKRNTSLEIIGIDNNESELFFLDQRYLQDNRVHFYLADIRDSEKICRIMDGIDIVFHTAAFKHVVMCEKSPFETVQTNICGVQNIIDAALKNKPEKVIFTSSDKAVNPTNVMGTTKLMGERLITAASNMIHDAGTVFSSTRFGNILGSNGSVVPIFHKQISLGGPVTLTDPAMTRFVMSVSQAVELLIASASCARGGEVLITKMPVIRISDLAEVMIEELAPLYGFKENKIAIEEIGPKPGEKLYEELMTEEEVHRAVELTDYYALSPAFKDVYQNVSYDYDEIVCERVIKPYVSYNEIPMEKQELLSFLREIGLVGLPEIECHA